MINLPTLCAFYRRSILGAVAVTFGLSLPVLISVAGVAVDTSRGWLVKQRLSSALDAAALAAGASASDDPDEIEEKVEAFLIANYPEDRIGQTTDFLITLDEETDTLTVSAEAMVETTFMALFGFEELTVGATVSVKREVRGLEVVMVLDVTGSMGPHMDTLRTAAENFVEILFDRANEPDDVKIGMVPFSNSVNVGPYGLGYDTDDFVYGDAFVIPPENDIYDKNSYGYGMSPYSGYNYKIDEEDLEYDPSEKGQWHGCIIEDNDLDTEDHEGPWYMYRYDWNGSYSSYYNNTYRSNPFVSYGDYYNHYYGPNYQCPGQPIVPLTSDEDFLLDAIDNLTSNGNTLVNIGMVWGWRVISPEEPFTEGAAYDSVDWDKAVMVMTDGVNTMDGQYNAHGRTDQHGMDAGDLDDKLAEICTAMKTAPNEILIYTVAFEDGVSDDTKALLEDCATDSSKFFDAPSSEDLIDVFEQISRELSNLHITN